MQISAYRAPASQSAERLLIEYLTGEGIGDVPIDKVQNGPREIANCIFERPPDFSKLWFVVEGDIVVFATYIRDTGPASAEDEEVDRIVASLKLGLKSKARGCRCPGLFLFR